MSVMGSPSTVMSIADPVRVNRHARPSLWISQVVDGANLLVNEPRQAAESAGTEIPTSALRWALLTAAACAAAAPGTKASQTVAQQRTVAAAMTRCRRRGRTIQAAQARTIEARIAANVHASAWLAWRVWAGTDGLSERSSVRSTLAADTPPEGTHAMSEDHDNTTSGQGASGSPLALQICGVCGRVLNHRVTADGDAFYEHTVMDQADDHPVIPVDVSINARMRCDFCSDELHLLDGWVVPAESFSVVDDGQGTSHASDSNWKACSTCVQYVRRRNWDGLVKRVVRRMKTTQGLTPDLQTGVERHLRQMYRQVQKHQTGRPFQVDPSRSKKTPPA